MEIYVIKELKDIFLVYSILRKMTKAQKEAQKRWRQSHREQYNAYQLELSN